MRPVVSGGPLVQLVHIEFPVLSNPCSLQGTVWCGVDFLLRCSAVCLIVGLGSSGVAELFGIESAIPMAEVPADEVPQAEKEELFCTYAAMILKDSELDISEDNINTLIKAAGGSTSSFFPALFAKLCAGKDLDSMLKVGGGGGGGGGVAAGGGGGGGGGAAPAEKKEEKKVVEEEEEEEMEFDLFG